MPDCGLAQAAWDDGFNAEPVGSELSFGSALLLPSMFKGLVKLRTRLHAQSPVHVLLGCRVLLKCECSRALVLGQV